MTPEPTPPNPPSLGGKGGAGEKPTLSFSPSPCGGGGRGEGSSLPPRGPLLGIDYGTVRVGLAVCDPDRIIASPLDTYALRSPDRDAAYFAKAATDHRAVGLVVGLPLHAGGEESDSSRAAREFGARLAVVTGLPVVYWDERFTTSLAEDALLGAKMSHKKRREKRDRVAAQMILQNFIDAGSPPGGTVVE